MKWIKGFLIVGMVMLAHSTVSINSVDANQPTQKAKGAKAKAPKKSSLFSSFTAGLKKVGSKVAAGAKAVKDKATAEMACRAGKGEVPGQKLYAIAAAGTPLTDDHIVAAHKTAPKSGRKK